LTKPLDLSNYHSHSPITGDTGGREIDKVSDYNQPFDEMTQTNLDVLASDLSAVSATVPVVKTESRELSTVPEQECDWKIGALNKDVHEVQIGT